MKKSFLVLVALSLFLSCNHAGKTAAEVEKVDTIVEDSWDYPEVRWRSDSLGCNGIRLKISEAAIIEHYSLLNKSSADFCEVFGKPNKREPHYEKANVEYLIYYLDTRCEGDSVNERADKAYITFEFVNDTLLEIPLVYSQE